MFTIGFREITGALMAGVLLYSAGASLIQAEPRQNNVEAWGRVQRVVDGDTLDLDVGLRIRLWGIDAPELRESGGWEAQTVLAALVKGRELFCTGRNWSHDRLVARCLRSGDNEDVGATLVQLGFALDCARYSKGTYRSLEQTGARERLPQKGYC